MNLAKYVLFLRLALLLFSDVEENINTVSIVKVTLEPPIIPYPTLYELFNSYEKKRYSENDKAIKAIEKEYDKALIDGKKQIINTLDTALKILVDKATLTKVANAAFAANKYMNNKKSKVNVSEKKNLKGKLSLLELGSNLTSSGDKKKQFLSRVQTNNSTSFLQANIIDSITDKILNLRSPSFNVELLYSKAIDSKVSSKVKQIEDERGKANKKFFNDAQTLLKKVNTIFIDALKSTLQIQLNSYTVDLEEVKNVLGKSTSFLQLNENHQKFDKPISLISTNVHQLNVAVGASEKPYPTVTDYVDDIQRKSTASFRLYRIKILQLVRTQIDTYIELLVTELHERIAQSYVLLGSISSSILED